MSKQRLKQFLNPFENDRIEHASELFDEDIENIKNNNINVSTHPSFIYEREICI